MDLKAYFWTNILIREQCLLKLALLLAKLKFWQLENIFPPKESLNFPYNQCSKKGGWENTYGGLGASLALLLNAVENLRESNNWIYSICLLFASTSIYTYISNYWTNGIFIVRCCQMCLHLLLILNCFRCVGSWGGQQRKKHNWDWENVGISILTLISKLFIAKK